MKAKKVSRPTPDDPAWIIAEKLTSFVNVAFGRKLRTSRAVYEAVVAALDAGYTADEIRISGWVCRCLDSHWLKEMLGEGLGPEYLLRFKGGTNPETGKQAKQWLDEMVSRVDEVNPETVGRVLRHIPEASQADETALLQRMGVKMGMVAKDFRD